MPRLDTRDLETDVSEHRRSVSGSCLWLDIAGFSALTDRASAAGAAGIETLSNTLTGLYGEIERVVGENAGQLLFFAGDGALCFWQRPSSVTYTEGVFAAANTALSLREVISKQDHAGFRPRVRQVILAGRWSVRRVGDSSNSALSLFTGTPLHALPSLMKQCAANQIVLSPRCGRALASRAQLDALARGAYLLRQLADPGATRSGPTQYRPRFGVASPSPVALPLRDSRAVSRGLMAMPAELRRVSVLFIATRLRCNTSFAEQQRLTQIVQGAATQEAGHLCQLVHDDKGVVYLLAFGLPGQARGEDAIRAVRCALQVAQKLESHHPALDAGIGVATGSIFCGPCGSTQNQHYCVIGNPVIRAARLAELRDGATLTDDETFQGASRRFDFAPLGRVALKGLEQPISGHRVLRVRRELSGPTQLVGRDTQVVALEVRMRRFAEEPLSHTIRIRGELGVGKSALLSTLPPVADTVGLTLFTATADPLDQHAPYAGLHALCRAVLLGSDAPASLDALLSSVRDGVELAALLNPLLLSDFELSDRVRQMSPAARRETRVALVVELFARRLERRPALVIVDDAHWLDASSVEVLEHLRRGLPGVLWVIAERPPSAEAARPASDEHWELTPLDAAGVELLVQSVARAELVDRGLATAIERTTLGNPLHAIELTRGLLASGRAQVERGLFALNALTTELVDVPGTLGELIQGRFDRLSAAARSVVRTASVLGLTFEPELAANISNQLSIGPAFDAALSELVTDGIITRAETCRFAHAAMQSVIYASLLPSERSGLHERAAQNLAAAYADRLPVVAARLAYHWHSAGNLTHSVRFSALAAAQALDGYAHADAIYLFRQSLAQDESLRGRLEVDLERARWSAGLGQALYSQSRQREAREAYDRALAWTGCPNPGQGVLALCAHALSAIMSSMLGRFGLKRRLESGRDRDCSLAAMRVMHDGGVLDVWEGKLFAAANKSLLGFRLAARVGVAREAAEAIADLGYMLESTPLRKFSPRLLQRGVELADATSDLEARTSTRVMRGMALTASGRSAEAAELLGTAEEFANRLGSGLWRHRACFMRGEALFFSGKWAEAATVLERAAAIASAAEPTVEGFSNCLRGLALANTGRGPEAVEVVTGTRGVALTRGECLRLQSFASHGICAEVLARAGRLGEALEAADFAFRLADSEAEANVFLAGLHGHAGVVSCLLTALEQPAEEAVPGWHRKRLRERVTVALARLRRFARLWGAGQPRLYLLTGRLQVVEGRWALAAKSFERAAQAAQRMAQGHHYELALAALKAASAGRGAI